VGIGTKTRNPPNNPDTGVNADNLKISTIDTCPDSKYSNMERVREKTFMSHDRISCWEAGKRWPGNRKAGEIPINVMIRPAEVELSGCKTG
jgi:hypothetical protein